MENTIKLTDEIIKKISKEKYYLTDDFIRDAKCYIQAIKEGRMICNIKSISRSGMSRNMKFVSMEQFKGRGDRDVFYLREYGGLFDMLGYTESRSKDSYFLISGCGMNMVFATNYRIINSLFRMGFMDKSTCDVLAQNTPLVI